MRLHVVGLPHTQTTRAFNHCAYTSKIRKFCSMMTAAGHEVFLYASSQNEATVAEHVVCITAQEQQVLLGGHAWWREGRIYELDWSPERPYWQVFNNRVTDAIRRRVQPGDVVCLPTGLPMQSIAQALAADATVVEAGVGYSGVLNDTVRIFESYAWMHCVYADNGGAVTADGRFFDAVIPNFFEVDEFPAGGADGEHFAFLSRMTGRKGYMVAIEATERLGAELWIGGIGGDRPEHPHVRYLGLQGSEGRAQLLGSARALFAPTMYLEPFGGVVVEAMLCGTPVLTTDWGAFPELVEDGVDGFRCRTLREFVDAAKRCEDLDREQIRARAIARFSTEAITPLYEKALARAVTLKGRGWYE